MLKIPSFHFIKARSLFNYSLIWWKIGDNLKQYDIISLRNTHLIHQVSSPDLLDVTNFPPNFFTCPLILSINQSEAVITTLIEFPL